MTILLPPKSSRTIARSASQALALCVTAAGAILAAANSNATLKHAPWISWIPDQRITSNGFSTMYFRVFDLDGNGFNWSTQSSDSNIYNKNNITIAACVPGDPVECVQDVTGYKISFTANPTNVGVTTITIKATENVQNGLTGTTAFTLRLDTSGNRNPPTISSLPNATVQLPSSTGSAEYKAQFVVGDLTEANVEDYADLQNQTLLTFSAISSNHNLLLDSTDGAITFTLVPAPTESSFLEGPRSWLLDAVCVAGRTGTTIVTVTVTDQNGNSTSTPFVLQVAPTNNYGPSIDKAISQTRYVECPVPTPTPPLPSYTYLVTTNETGGNVQDLRVIASSSNTSLVPNDSTHLGCSISACTPLQDGTGTITITPVLPLPSPSPGVPQTSTITLSVIDDAYVRQTTFLYVATPQSGIATSYSRPSGVYLLDPKAHSDHRRDDLFLTGEMRRVSWNDLESEPINGVDQFHFDTVLRDDVFAYLPPGQHLSLNLIDEPCYIAHNPPQGEDTRTWCDTDPNRTSPCLETSCSGTLRAVPWNSYLRKRRNNFLQALATYLNTNGYMDKIWIINPNLPGGDTGIRNVYVDFDPNLMPGYSREALLGTVQDELRNVQANFGGKLVQIGFFTATDALNSSYNNTELWQWLYQDANNWVDANGVTYTALPTEFNGVIRSRVSFFQEDLAATRGSTAAASTPTPPPTLPPTSSGMPNYFTPPSTTAYTFTPHSSQMPSFFYYSNPTDDQLNQVYNNGITFQANTPWISPFKSDGGNKLTKTLNGSPNDGMEAAFNTYLSQYLEVYQQDVDQAHPQSTPATFDALLWEPELRSWKDYTDHLRSEVPIERAPAGLTVERTSATSNLIKWEAVYAGDQGPIHYTVQRKSGSQWSVTVCSDTTATQCNDSGTTGSVYTYRVQAWKGTGYDVNAPWAYVAVLLSESSYDGYVTTDLTPPYTLGAAAYPSATQPGIRAGQTGGTLLDPGFDMRGFLSFDTSSLNGFAVRGAKLRLKQYNTSNSAFDTLGICMVDIEKGVFNGNVALVLADFSASDTNTAVNVANIPPAASPPDWVVAQLNLNGVSHINNVSSGRTQFRLYFHHSDAHETWVGWYSGETNTSNPSTPPQLIVQYTP